MATTVKEFKEALEKFPQNTALEMIMVDISEGCLRDIYSISNVDIFSGNDITYLVFEGGKEAVSDDKKAEFMEVRKKLENRND